MFDITTINKIINIAINDITQLDDQLLNSIRWFFDYDFYIKSNTVNWNIKKDIWAMFMANKKKYPYKFKLALEQDIKLMNKYKYHHILDITSVHKISINISHFIKYNSVKGLTKSNAYKYIINNGLYELLKIKTKYTMCNSTDIYNNLVSEYNNKNIIINIQLLFKKMCDFCIKYINKINSNKTICNIYFRHNKLLIKYTDNTKHKIKFNNIYKLDGKNGIIINKYGLVPFSIDTCTNKICVYQQ